MKKIIPILIITSCVILTPIRAHAFLGFGDIVFDPTAVGKAVLIYAKQIKQHIEEIKTAVSTVTQVQKALGSDQVFQNLANLAVNTTANQAALWAQVGFNGGPAVVEDIKAFQKNIDIGIVNSIVKDITDPKLTNIFSGSLANVLIAKTRNDSTSIRAQNAPTLPATIQNDICTDAGLTALAKREQARRDSSAVFVGNVQDLNSIKSQMRSNFCTGNASTKAQQEKLNDCFANDFNCGGWGAWLELTSNPNNTLNGQTTKTLLATKQAQDSAQKIQAAKMVDNTLPMTKCLDAPTAPQNTSGYTDILNVFVPNKPPCQNEIVTTSASLVKDIINKTTSAGLDRVITSQGMNGFQSNFGDLLNGTMNNGYSSNSSASSPSRISLSNITIGSNSSLTNKTIAVGNGDSNTAAAASAATVFSDGFSSNIKNLNSLKNIINNYLSYISSVRNEVTSIDSCITNGENTSISNFQNILSSNEIPTILTASQIVAIKQYIENLPNIITLKSFISTTNNNLNSKTVSLNEETSKISGLIADTDATKTKINNVSVTSPLEVQKIFQNYTDSNTLAGNNDYLTGILGANLEAEYVQERTNLGNVSYEPKDPVAVQLQACQAFMPTVNPSNFISISKTTTLAAAKATANTLINQNKPESLTPNDHIVGSRANLISALSNANANVISTQNIIDNQASMLNTAITTYNNAIVPLSNVQTLAQAKANASTLISQNIPESTKPGDHTVGSRFTLISALASADATILSPQPTIDTQVINLNKAIDAYNSTAIPLSNIKNLTQTKTTASEIINLKSPESKLPGDHIVGSRSVLISALNLTNATAESPQSLVDSQTETLNTAIETYNLAIVP